MERLTSKKVHSAEIARLGPNGGLNKISVPVGEERKGWRSLIAHINSLTTNRKEVDPRAVNEVREVSSYKEALKRNQEEPTIIPVQEPKNTDQPDLNPQMVALFLSSGVILQCKYFHDSWHDIIKALQQNLSAFSSVSPLQPDKALLAFEDEEQARVLAKIKGWYKVGKYQIRFFPWSTETMIGDQKVSSYEGWIKVRNLPLDKWSIKNFKKIGDECGG